MQKRLDAVDGRRPVLYGEATLGNAWSAYQVAIALAVKDTMFAEQVRPSMRAKMQPRAIAALLGKHNEILVQLRRGAHCERARDPVDWSKGFSSAKNLLVLRGVSNLVVTKALAQIEAGESEAAVETLLDGAQVGRDLMHSHMLVNEIIGCAILQISTCEVMQDLALRALRSA